MADPEEVCYLRMGDYAREILAYVNHKPMIALELADGCGAHHSTIYCRIQRLQSLDLRDELPRVDPG